MKLHLILASSGLHVLVFVSAPARGLPAPVERSEFTPIEIVEIPEPAELAPLEPAPPPPPEPAAEAAPPADAAPKPMPRRRAAPRPQAAPTPEASANPRRLGLTMSNRPGNGDGVQPGAGRGNGRGSKTGRPSDAGSTRDSGAPKCRDKPTKPRAIRKVPIEYPKAARAQGLQGKLVLRARVDPRGSVVGVSVLRSVGAAVDEPAKKALHAWRFEAATRCGKPVASDFTIAREFELGD